MANAEMYDYVSTVAPDVDQTLSVTPQGIVVEEGIKDVAIHELRGGAEERIILSDQSYFFVTMQWTAISEANAGTIFDLIHDTAKACGMALSFKWAHPTDGHTYVVRFANNPPRSKQNAAIWGLSVRLKVLGRIADA